MHIITVTNQPSSKRGGIEKSTLDVCRSLENRGHKISLIYFKDGDLLEEYRKFSSQLIEAENLAFNKQRLVSSTINFLGSILATSKQLEITDKKNTVIYVDEDTHCLFAAILAWQQNLPSVFHMRLPFYSPFPRKYQFAIKQLQKFIAVSHQTKLDWVSCGIKPEKVSVVYNGINPDFFQPAVSVSEVRKKFNLTTQEKVISYIGRIDPPKGIETLIKAFGMLCKENGQSLKLLIAGKPVVHSSYQAGEKYQRSLQDLAANLGIANCVEFLGHVAEPRSVYQASDLTVIPSLNSEPFGRTVIESMSCGVPVLGSKIGGIPEILTGEFAEGLFVSGNAESLLSKLEELINWRQTDPGLGERCRHHVVTNFSLEKTIEGVEKVFLEVVK